MVRTAAQPIAPATTSSHDSIRQILDTSFHLERIDPQRSMELAREALELARASNNAPLTVSALRSVGMKFFLLTDYTTAMGYFEQSLALASELGLYNAMVALHNNMADIYSRRGDFTTALGILVRAAQIDGDGIDPIMRQVTAEQTGIIYAKRGEYVQALDAFFHALSLLPDEPVCFHHASCYNNIAGVYQANERVADAAKYYQKALSTYKTLGDRQGEALVLLNLGAIYSNLKQHSEAEHYLQQAHELFHDLGSQAREAGALAYLGSLYLETERASLALPCLEKALAIVEESGNREVTAGIYLHMAEAYLQQKDYSDVLSVLDKALEVTLATNDPVKQYECYELFANVYEQMGDASQALIYYKRYAELRNDVQAGEKQRVIAEMQARFEVERLEREREVQQLRADSLQRDMEYKSKELTVLALQLMQKNECLAKLKEHVQARGTGGRRNTAILHLVETSLRPNDDWKTFARQFQAVYQNFHPALLKICPTLTPTEIKICSLIKSGLANKDIGNILFTSVRTVETHRNTIRKKLKIPAHGSLSSYIIGLS